MNDEYIDINDDTPLRGQYCIIKIESYFAAWYEPNCEIWPWIMDSNFTPVSQVTEWKKADPCQDDNGYLDKQFQKLYNYFDKKSNSCSEDEIEKTKDLLQNTNKEYHGIDADGMENLFREGGETFFYFPEVDDE